MKSLTKKKFDQSKQQRVLTNKKKNKERVKCKREREGGTQRVERIYIRS